MNSFNNGHLILSGIAHEYGVEILSQGKVSPDDLKNAVGAVGEFHWAKPIIEGMVYGRINFPPKAPQVHKN